MDRRQLLAAALIAAATPHFAFAASRTRWKVRGSEGLDALAFFGPLSGKPLYTRYYEAELADFRPGFPADAQAALDRLQKSADARGWLLAPGLCLLFSGGPDETLDDVIASARDPEGRLFAAYRASEYWDPEDWNAVAGGRADLVAVLEALKAADFAGFRRRWIGPHLEPRIASLSKRLEGLDVIAEQERLLGRQLKPDLDIGLLCFSKPHGVRVQGQRFLNHVSYPDDLVIRIAGHELLHPPFPMDGPTAKAALAVLSKDAVLQRVLAEHDPSFGYNTLEGILNEDVAQALDQIIAERLGVSRPPAQRWTEADGGMHILAAGLYGLLKADGFDRTGGAIEVWLAKAVQDGRLAPGVLHSAAARVLERTPDRLWPPSNA